MQKKRRGTMRVPKKAMVSLLSSLLLLTAIGPSQAADTTPMNANPGPEGSFSWEGFNWDKRFWDGGPHFNKDYDAANVASPDANGHVKLNLTNPTGNAPVAAEFQSTRRGFGYGTYSTVVEKNVAALQKEVVWGCLFTYDPDAAPSFTEIDLCEASAWGGGAEWGESWPVEQGHGYWVDASKGPGVGNNTITFPANNSPIMTHKMVWEPGKITFESFSGEGYNGPLLKRTVMENANVPVPAKEHVIFNLWVTGGGGGNPQKVKPEQVIVRDFSFIPAGSAPITSPPPTTTPAPSPAPSFPSCSGLKMGDAWAGVGTHCRSTGAVSAADAVPETVKVEASPLTPAAVEATQAPSPTPPPTETVTAAPTPIQTPSAPSKSATSYPFPPANATVPPPGNEVIKLSESTTKSKKQHTTTLRWTGAVGSSVTVIVNGSKKVIPNNGKYIFYPNGEVTTYQVCDSAGCSAALKVNTP